MRSFTYAILFASVSLVVAFRTGRATLREGHAQHARRVQARSSMQYNLVDHYSAQDFMNESIWSYFTGPDPTGGQTKYLSHADAANAGLTYVQNGQAILAVDSKNDLPLGAKRSSVRIASTKTYSSGLFISDFAAMAHGCAVWPAYWSLGRGWPDGGEMDIIEGVNQKTANQYTLHSGQGPDCVLVKNPFTSSGGSPYTGTVMGTECKSSEGHDAGCAFLDSGNTSFGHGFNMAGGGVFVLRWESDSIKIWHFERQSIPQDIQDGQPDPSSWSAPVAFWSSSGCDFASHFYDHRLVIDSALCGGWAHDDYANSGCPATCADQITKGSNFHDAKWKINYIDVYQ